MKYPLIDKLRRGGKAAEIWSSPDGSTAFVLPHGGRILGLIAPGSDRNFFWTHPALESVDSLGTFYESSAWHNSGGDRTWLSPEIDFFLPHFPRLDSYVQPRELDPGNFGLEHENGGIRLTNRCTLRLSRSQRVVDFEISKLLSSASNPLQPGSECTPRILYAGFTLQTRLRFTNPRADPVLISLWSLLQLPHGGDLLISTSTRSAATPYFGQVDEDDLLVTEHLVRYRMRSVSSHKLGFGPSEVTGRVGYLYSDGTDSCLVVRNIPVNPAERYLDIPCSTTSTSGSAIEGCNVNSDLGKFSELEYHSAAIGGSKGDFTFEDESQLWAFRGKECDILTVARILISPEV
jgi:hypothetical protein